MIIGLYLNISKTVLHFLTKSGSIVGRVEGVSNGFQTYSKLSFCTLKPNDSFDFEKSQGKKVNYETQ
jgi:hypothetical protein